MLGGGVFEHCLLILWREKKRIVNVEFDILVGDFVDFRVGETASVTEFFDVFHVRLSGEDHDVFWLAGRTSLAVGDDDVRHGDFVV